MILRAAIYQDGRIYAGKRHPDIIREMIKTYKLPPPIKGTQGFITDMGEFLDRVQARQHFIKSGQKSLSGKLHDTLLFSEDLYWSLKEQSIFHRITSFL